VFAKGGEAGMEETLRWLGHVLIDLGFRLMKLSNHIGRQNLEDSFVVAYQNAPLAKKAHLLVDVDPSDSRMHRSLCGTVDVDVGNPAIMRLDNPAICGLCRNKALAHPRLGGVFRQQLKGLL